MQNGTGSITRRDLLVLGAAIPSLGGYAAEPTAESMPWAGPANVKKLYLWNSQQVGWGWPRPDVDLKQDIANIEGRLAELERRYPGQIKFTGGEMVGSAEELTKWLADSAAADVILAFNMVTVVRPMIIGLAASGKPTLVFAVPYAGHDWVTAANLMQRGAKFELIASSDFTALDPYVPLFAAIHHLRYSKALLVSRRGPNPAAEDYTKQFGTQFGYPTFADLRAASEAVDVREAQKLADEYVRGAVKTVEPTQPEIVASLRMYLGMQEVLRREKANAIAIDCLGGFNSGELKSYPCVGFSKLNDVGLIGACECDLHSTMTQLLVTPFSGKPGFINDPVIDMSRNEVIAAHCMSTTRFRGIEAEPSPYLIRNHLEDHKGVSMQVLAPAGGTVTMARFADPKKMMFATGESLGNVDNERGCRTKVRARVTDARKLLTNWSAAANAGQDIPGMTPSLHRVLFYGDYGEQLERLGRLTGFQVVHEV
ncbi:MAG: hypothetical protein ABSC23_18540 [Bryobacteraceae bacterium]|jgi:hypothetical protein